MRIGLRRLQEMVVHTTERLTALRNLLKDNQLDAWVAPTEDAHASEYVAPCDARRSWISGFDGSAGIAVVCHKEAFLFTDGRYFLQAGDQLDENWKLMKRGAKDVPTWQEFLAKLPDGTKIGVDASTVSANDSKDIIINLPSKSKLLPFINDNLVDKIWDTRPERPASSVFVQSVKRAGKSSQEKIADLRKEIAEKNATAVVVNMLDEVAWLLNLRGSDIEYNPVFFSYVLVTKDNTTLFINPKQISPDVKQYLESLQVKVEPYENATAILRSYTASYKDSTPCKILISEQTSWAIAEAIGEGKYDIVPSPVTLAKAIKNEVEMEGFRQSHIRDGAALTAYFAWLEEQLDDSQALDEVEVADKLESFRAAQPLFKGLSFPTISSTGPNGSIIHYRPIKGQCSVVAKEQPYLCDSGAQYEDGTTDVTRTLHFGVPSEDFVRANTLVLKGHIAIDQAIFPKGTTGFKLDILARTALWREGLDFNHGTGHGVGSFLNVHEGPASIAPREAANKVALKPGMCLSNEPGYYKDGHWGVRIENLVLVKEVKLANDFDSKGWLGFEHITMCPIQTSIIDKTLLSPEEKLWLNDYHAEVKRKLAPFYKDDPRAMRYLEKECQPI